MDTTAQTSGSGAFLESAPIASFIPEQFTAEARQMGEATERFVREQVAPQVRRLEHGSPQAMRDLLVESARLGLLGIDIPTEYGGLSLPKTTSALITEKTALEPSFAVSHAVHTSVGSLPILLFGTESQAQSYLPRLTEGALIGAYALTEPEAGSDALAGRTRAERKASHYCLNGSKIWITNAGFADLFVVFARVEGERFTAFLVPRQLEGFTVEREERKLGLHGSSTCRIVLENVCVPLESRLGEESEGAYVALYTLNLGRFKIGAAALGLAREAWRMGCDYAQTRKQFGRPIIEFDLVWRKLARGKVLQFVLESALYRLAGDLEQRFAQGEGQPYAVRQQAWRAASAQFAGECALIKVAGTEVLHQIVDDCLQIHGGYGFSEEYPIARLYRDTRVNRIYEGTNEINRLNLVDRLLVMRRKGLWGPVSMEPTDVESVEGVLAALRWLTGRVFVALEAQDTVPQVVVEPLADALIALYLLDSAHYRAQVTQEDSHRHAVAFFTEWVRRQLSGWWADLAFLVGRDPLPVVPVALAPLYEAVWYG